MQKVIKIKSIVIISYRIWNFILIHKVYNGDQKTTGVNLIMKYFLIISKHKYNVF